LILAVRPELFVETGVPPALTAGSLEMQIPTAKMAMGMKRFVVM